MKRFGFGLVLLLLLGLSTSFADSTNGYLFLGSTVPTANYLVLTISGSNTPVILSTYDNPLNPCGPPHLDCQGATTIPNQGWWSTDSILPNYKQNPDYAAGLTPLGETLRNYFTFDLTGVTGVVTNAVLELQRFGSAGPTYLGYTLSGVPQSTVTAQSLNAKDDHTGTRDQDIFNALGAGTSYGSFRVVTAGNSTDILNFGLGNAAISDLNATIASNINGTKWFDIGGKTYDVGTNDTSPIVGGPQTSVPEPASLILMGAGLLVLARKVRK